MILFMKWVCCREVFKFPTIEHKANIFIALWVITDFEDPQFLHNMIYTFSQQYRNWWTNPHLGWKLDSLSLQSMRGTGTLSSSSIWPSLSHIARLEILVILRAKSSQPLRGCWAIRTLHSSHKASFMAQKNKTNICHKQRNWIKIKDFSARTTSSEGLDGRCGVVTQKTTTINNIPLRS